MRCATACPGLYNVAADGVLALSEVAGLLGKRYAPVLPPWGTGIAAAGLRRVGVRIPPEAMNQLRYGRGVDNRRFKAAGFGYQHTSRETVPKLGEHLRLDPVLRGLQEPYRYEREVEDFLRWSPHVRNARDRRSSSLSRDQIAELERLLAENPEAERESAQATATGWRRPRPARLPPSATPNAPWNGRRRRSAAQPSPPSRPPSAPRRPSAVPGVPPRRR